MLAMNGSLPVVMNKNKCLAIHMSEKKQSGGISGA
jgi:nitrate reductase cytochrome c-type subunit